MSDKEIVARLLERGEFLCAKVVCDDWGLDFCAAEAEHED